ncbi:MAG: CTAG/PCC1 family protein [Candidatus Diapherotrites archaeon]|nr:CTAG/PCC1 family protein [Candidatus Diapherotrites archaeon]
MSSIYSADISIACDNAEQARILYDSIAPEATRFKTERSSAKINLNKKDLEIKIEAKDLTALRASFNSIFRLLSTVDNVIDIEVN